MARTPLFVALALLLLPAAAPAVTRNVPGQYATIQAAIDASNFGDVVQVAAGTYHENIFMQQAGVSILGAGAAFTTIDGGGIGRVIEFFSISSNTTFSGFRITGGVASTGGGGIRCVLASPQILDCIIEGNTAPDGGGIFLTQSRPQIKRCTIRNNLATGPFGPPSDLHRGGGVYVENNSPALIEDCDILDNEQANFGTTANGGGGLWIGGAGAVTVRRCEIRGNRAYSAGGIMISGSPGSLIEDCVIEDNSASYSGGRSAVIFSGSGTIRRCSISFNPTGGVSFTGPGTVSNCTIAFNTFRGLELGGTGVVVDHTIVAKNFNTPGVIASQFPTEATFTCNDVWGHESGDYGGNYPSQSGTNGNISENPLFCNPGLGDLGLGAGSPCLASQNPCGLVGDYELGCAVTEVRRSTWGQLKSRYR